MSAGPAVARVASLIGDPTRALMLVSLMDGRSRTAGELARVAGITPQTASSHLAKLVDARLVEIERQGRHRYHRIASPEVGAAVEGLMAVAPTAPRGRLGPSDSALRHARVCYDHLAGELALSVTDRCAAMGWIARDGTWRITDAGRLGLAATGVQLPDPKSRRPEIRSCMDWSERRPHIAGQLGAHLLALFVQRGCLKRRSDSRALQVMTNADALVDAFFAGRS